MNYKIYVKSKFTNDITNIYIYICMYYNMDNYITNIYLKYIFGNEKNKLAKPAANQQTTTPTKNYYLKKKKTTRDWWQWQDR